MVSGPVSRQLAPATATVCRHLAEPVNDPEPYVAGAASGDPHITENQPYAVDGQTASHV